jgi:Transcription termination factor nusG
MRVWLAAHGERWYIIHAYSNFENKVADAIREQAKHRHLDHLFEEIIVPTEKLIEVRHGQKHATERKFFPGYVLAKVELTLETALLLARKFNSYIERFPVGVAVPAVYAMADESYVGRAYGVDLERSWRNRLIDHLIGAAGALPPCQQALGKLAGLR